MKPDLPTRDYARSAGATVADLHRGALARVARVGGGRTVRQRVRMMGIRPGVQVRVVHGPDRRGAVLEVGGARIALGHAVLPTIVVVQAQASENLTERPR